MYKHYYKKNNLGKVEKITVIGRNVEKKLACYVKGHISEGDPITEKYYISFGDILTEQQLSIDELKDIAQESKLTSQIAETRKKNKNKKIDFKTYLKQFDRISPKLMRKGIMVIPMAEIDIDVLKKLADNPENYFPELKKKDQITVTGFDENTDSFTWVYRF